MGVGTKEEGKKKKKRVTGVVQEVHEDFFFFLIRMQSEEPISESPSRSCRGRSSSAGEVGGVSEVWRATHGCSSACLAVIRFDGSVVISFLIKSSAVGSPTNVQVSKSKKKETTSGKKERKKERKKEKEKKQQTCLRDCAGAGIIHLIGQDPIKDLRNLAAEGRDSKNPAVFESSALNW